jgi:AMMECR1 domain-containing protein
MEFRIEEGELLIKFARKNIEYYLEHNERMPIPNDLNEKFNEKLGAFVTLSKRRADFKDCRDALES